MDYLASDELKGRMPGEAGYDIAAEYCATQFRQAGLIPVCLDAAGNKTYLQQVRIMKKSTRVDSELRIQTNENMQSLGYGAGYSTGAVSSATKSVKEQSEYVRCKP